MRWLLVWGCLIAIACGTPLASARSLDLPGDTTLEATGPGGAVFSYDENGFVCTPPSGSTFPLGETTVNCVDGDENPARSFKVTVVDTTPPALSLPGPITAEATGPGGASVTFTVTATDAVDLAPTISCNHASGETFPIDVTVVTCTASDHSGNTSAPQSFTITVVDTTPPVVTPPADVSVETEDPNGATVTYPDATATDAVSGSVPATCVPASGSHFSVGTTVVTCSATDGHGNTGTASFNVTVVLVDKVPPVLTVPGSISAEATGPSGAAVTFTVTATDNIDPNPTISCNHSSGDTYPLGPTTVTCTASDHSGNTSPPGSFDITISDTRPPVIPDLPNISAEATGPSGASVSYPPVTASDIVDGTIPATCAPPSGSTFPLGASTVACNATDAHNNHAVAKTFTITVRDTTGPAFTGVPGPLTVEANGPSGSVVNYTTPTAVDLVDGLIPVVTCSPPSGAVFALGKTKVTCSATDSHGHTGSTFFNVTVLDTTPPNLLVPVATSVHATTPTGIPNTVSSIVSFLAAASARDIVDPAPVLTNNAPSFLPVGTLTVIFTAQDHSGNSVSREVTLIVLPMPPPGTPPLPPAKPPVIPSEVKNLKVVPRNGGALITWNAGGGKVKVIRSSSSTRSLSAVGDEQIVYTGTASRYLDRGLQNGVEYRYVVRAVDSAGNESAGVAAVVVPRRDLLRSPKDGARLRKPPKLIWAADSTAKYYNAQLLLNNVKILSVWPTGPSYMLKKSWKYNGHKYKLKPGTYTWYVWPGHGVRSAVDYGALMGSRTFRIVP